MAHTDVGIEHVIGCHISTILQQETDKSKFSFDVGMNSGFFTLVAAALGTPVRSFDPQPACHALMAKAIETNGFTKVMVGLGDGGRAEAAAVMRMHVSACNGGYSWPDAWGKGMATVVEVPMRRLDQ